MDGIFLVTGVFIGTYIWWGTLTIGTEKLKKRAKQIDPVRLNKIFGMLLFMFGAGILIRLLAT